MKICVVVPTKQYLGQAGARIRYGRIQDVLGAHDTEMETEIIDNFRRDTHFPYDVYLLSKCYDARSVALAASLVERGKLVGIDLFDDYFSQIRDSRLTHLREWLRTMGRFLDFVLCSTPRLRTVSAAYFPALPCHVLNDPFGSLDADAIGQLSRDKVERMRASRTIRIGWFGMGDNPYFSVGLQDLVAFGPSLNRVRDRGYDVRLSILTNARALTAPSLEALRWLSVPYMLDEWTEEKEQAQIADSDACFLPVNGQSFSVVKSLNRAISTLTGGAQVLSCGYPLYAPLGSFLYRDPVTLVSDIEAGRPAVRAETIPALLNMLDQWANPQVEAANFHGFLQELLAARSKRPASAAGPQYGTIGLIHGRRSSGSAHKLAQRLGHFSIGMPFSAPSLNYDVVLSYLPQKQRIDLHLSKAALEWLDPAILPRVVSGQELRNKKTTLSIEQAWEDRTLLRQLALCQANKSEVAVKTFYAPVMRSLQAALHTLFPALQFFISEMDPTCWVGTVGSGGAVAPRMAQEEVAAHEA